MKARENNLSARMETGAGAELWRDGTGINSIGDSLVFSTLFPGGRYGLCTFFLPRNPTGYFSMDGGYKVLVDNGSLDVWEGFVTHIERSINPTGFKVIAAGAWGQKLAKFSINKPWADDRVTTSVWIYGESASAAEKCTVNRSGGQIMFVPKAEQWASNELAKVVRTVPTGETIERITGTLELQEAAQTWEIRIRDTVGAVTLVNQTASGSAAFDIAAGDATYPTARQALEIQFINTSGGNQTPTSDGTYLGTASVLMVYTEDEGANDVTMTTITTDIVTLLAGGPLSADTDAIAAAGSKFKLEPFITKGQDKAHKIIDEATRFGDANNNAWGASLLPSFLSSDGFPKMQLAQWPVLTDWEYVADAADFDRTLFTADYDAVENWIPLEYTDKSGVRITVTPDDDSSLKDATSITRYGERHADTISLAGTWTQTQALAFGKRYLAQVKNPVFKVNGPLTLTEKIRRKGAGGWVPVSEVYARQRIRITDYGQDISGDGATFVIIKTNYVDAGQRLTMEVGKPDTMLRIMTLQRPRLEQVSAAFSR